MEKKRQSNFELLRLVLMLMIVSQHLINNGVLSKDGTGFYDISTQVGSLGTFLEVAVNCFIIISGYFGIRISIKKIIRLILDMVIIGESIYLISALCGLEKLTIADCIYFAIPIHWWFIAYYIVLMLFAPYINKLVNNISKGWLLALVVMMYVILSVPATLAGYDFGGGISNFIFMYIIGRYLRLHFNNLYPVYFWIIGYVLFSLCSAVGDWYLHEFSNVPYTWGIKFFQSNSIFIIPASICFFNIFSKVRFESSAVNVLAKSSLGIYIIHEHPVIKNIYLKRLGILNNVDSGICGWALNFIIVLCLVYCLSLLLESVRLFVFDRINDRICAAIVSVKPVRLFSDFMSDIAE